MPRCCLILAEDLVFLAGVPLTDDGLARWHLHHRHQPWRYASCFRAETRALREPVVWLAAAIIGLVLARVVVG